MIVWWVFALALLTITRVSPAYAENGIMLDGVIEKIAWAGDAPTNQWTWGDEDFYSWNQKIPSPQGWVSPLSKGEQSWDDGEELPKAPQNDEWEADNNPDSSSMTDHDWNREQGEDGVEPELNWKKDAKDSSAEFIPLSGTQNDEWDADNNPGSSSMTDQDWNREQGEDGVEPGLNWKKDAQDSSLGSEWQADEQITQIAKSPKLMQSPLRNGGNNVIKNIDYQHEQEWKPKFEYGFISIEDPNNPGHGITIMDRNLWATTWNIASADSYWYKYQRWNNYWFSDSEPIELSLGWWLVWHDGYNNNGYYSTEFINGDSNDQDVWLDSSHHDWVWWGSNDSSSNNRWANEINPIDRRWPCPEWYHVPSAWEWWLLVKYYRDTYATGVVLSWDEGLYSLSDSVADFMNYFKLPFAGSRHHKTAILNIIGDAGYYWSSSPHSENIAYRLTLHSLNLNGEGNFYRALGISVRCFANEYQGPIKVTVTFESNWWTAVGSQTVESWSVLTEPSAPTKTWFVFDGWYEDSTFQGEKFDFSTQIIGGVTLYAKWIADQFKIDETDWLYKSELWYYIIDENDVRYPQWCNTPWLPDPDKYCILAIYADETRNGWGACLVYGQYAHCRTWMVLIAPWDTDIIKNGYDANNYCRSIDIWGMGFELPISHAWTWRDMINSRDKIYNFTASGSSKANHYWASPAIPTDINCTLEWGCWVESSSTLLSVRCVSWDAYIVSFVIWWTTVYQRAVPINSDHKITEPSLNLLSLWYTLDGWYKDNQLIEKWDFDVDKVNENMTLYAKRIPNVYTITFDTDGWGDIAPITWQYNSPVAVPSDPTKTGYTFVGWDQSIPASIPANDITITAQRTINQYTITFVDEDGSVLLTWEYNYGTSGVDIIKPLDPTKVEDVEYKYTFAWWSPVISDVVWDTIYTATYTSERKWWRRSWRWKIDPQPSDPQHPSADDLENKPENKPSDPVPSSPKWWDKPSEKPYKPETIDAYNRAYANNFTQYANINEARLSDPLNRSEMAKITSIFATEFLGKIPDESKQKICSKYSDMWKVDNEMKYFITQSCELGYMWYRENGIDIKDRFYPYTPLTLAEASTVLSRILRWTDYALEWKDWYKWHLYAVYESELIDDISKPFSKITREEAFIMLYRLYQKNNTK